MDPFREVILQWLREDQTAPAKQRHTAKRIYDRLRDEYAFTGGESTVRRFVARLRQEIEGPKIDAKIVLAADPGEMAQVDWGQAKVVIGGVEQIAHLFCLRLRFSSVPFVWAAPHERLEAFLEGHTRALTWLDGVPARIVYDNLSSAVHRMLQGHQREENERFVVMRSHYLFDSVFCNPRSGHEKGSVENLVGYVRRNALTPMPEVESWDELNQRLLMWCEGERDRLGDRWQVEKAGLSPLPAGTYKPCVHETLQVNKMSLVTFQRNRYSVPVEWVSSVVRVEAYTDRLEIWGPDRRVIHHRRMTGRNHTELMLEHYLDALARKPFAVTHAAVVRELPEPYQALRRTLCQRDPSGYRELVRILLLHREFTAPSLREAVERALASGCLTAEEIRLDLLNHERGQDSQNREPAPLPAKLEGIEITVGCPASYNRLLEVGA